MGDHAFGRSLKRGYEEGGCETGGMIGWRWFDQMPCACSADLYLFCRKTASMRRKTTSVGFRLPRMASPEAAS